MGLDKVPLTHVLTGLLLVAILSPQVDKLKSIHDVWAGFIWKPIFVFLQIKVKFICCSLLVPSQLMFSDISGQKIFRFCVS